MKNFELHLAKVLAELLEVDVEQISMTLSFSDQGVDSLLALRFVRKIHDEFGINLELEVFFDYPSLRELAIHLSESSLLQSKF